MGVWPINQRGRMTWATRAETYRAWAKSGPDALSRLRPA